MEDTTLPPNKNRVLTCYVALHSTILLFFLLVGFGSVLAQAFLKHEQWTWAHILGIGALRGSLICAGFYACWYTLNLFIGASVLRAVRKHTDG